MDAQQESLKFKREHFIRIQMDLYHYYYSFGVPGFELCLEPCAEGFDVAIYTDNDGIPQFEKSSLEPKRCTETGDYTQIDDLFGDRKDEDWNKALEIADELLEKYIEDRQKLRELLARKETGMKCKFCGRTDSNKPGLTGHGGILWVAPGVCFECEGRSKGNNLISGEEIIAVRESAKTLTIKEGLRLTMKQGCVPVIPMHLKSGFCASMTILEPEPGRNPIEVVSVGITGKKGLPDHADADEIVGAILGKGFTPIVGLKSKQLYHYFKRRE